MDLNLNILVISLNINGLNVPIKIKGYQIGYFYRNMTERASTLLSSSPWASTLLLLGRLT